MKKKTTRKSLILQRFAKKPFGKFSCDDITKYLIKRQKLSGSVAHYLSGSVSSVLAKLVKEKVLKYADTKTARGGHLYEADLKNMVKK